MSVTSRALWYIESHLGDELSLDDIAAAVHVSRFHLSRAFAVSAGLPLGAYIRARRLGVAAAALAAGAPDILAVALSAGYGSHEAFTRAFRQQFAVTPEHFRAHGNLESVPIQEPLRMNPTTSPNLPPPRIAEAGPLLILGLSDHYGWQSNAAIPSQWNRFVPYLGSVANQKGALTYGVMYNADDAGNYDYLCGVEVTEYPANLPELSRLRIPPQTYAVFWHAGHVSAIAATIGAIWNHALASSGRHAADGPSFERYDERFDPRTGLGGVEIWIPVKA